MSRIQSSSFQPGETVTAALLNEKFDDIVTVTTGSGTTGLDDANFRSESIDILQMNTVGTSGKADIILRDWKLQDNGLSQSGGTNYTSTINTNLPVEVNHAAGTRLVWAAGQQLATGDILRCHWSVYIPEYGYTEALFGGAILPAFDQQLEPCWCIWLQWDITSNALANWVEVPNQGNLRSNFVTSEGSTVDSLQATMTIPHGTRYDNAGAQAHLQQTRAMYHRAYAYVNGGAAVTIYGIRMVINGLYHPLNSANTANLNALAKDNANPGWSGQTINIASARLLGLIQRTD